MNHSEEVIEILKKSGGLVTDSHLVYVSGKHGSVYLNKDAIYPHTEYASRIGELFAEQNKGKGVEVVAGPALGGIILSQWTAYHLSRLEGREVLGIYAEKMEGEQILRRGYDKVVSGKKVLVVEDITNTGGSVKKVIGSVREAGGEVVGVSVIINRSPGDVTSESIGAEFSSLAEFPAEAFEEKDCPLCAKGVPINTDVGHGKKYLEQKNG